MLFEPNAEQRQLVGTVREFLEAEAAPGAAERDRTGAFPDDLVARLGELGVMGALIEEEYGGTGLDTATFAMIVEEIARVDGSLCLTVASHNSLCSGHIALSGSTAQKREWLPPLASGSKLGAWCLTEPGAGSDAAALSTRAVQQGDRFIVNGAKNFITQGSVGHTYVVMARTDDPPPGRGPATGVSAFIVDRESPGLTPGKPESKLGLRASDTSTVSLADVNVPAGNLLGERGGAFKDVMQVLDGGRIGIAAMAVGLGRAALETATRYGAQRKAFGKAITGFQAIQFKIAEAATALEAARLLYLKAAAVKDAGRPYVLEAAQAKLFASEAATRICDDAIQILGGYGYMEEYPVSRYWRDVRLTRIGEGTSEVQHLIIAREYLRGLSD
jgi:alkylation response protein AidB-like acyl-CoA dehydrogenase